MARTPEREPDETVVPPSTSGVITPAGTGTRESSRGSSRGAVREQKRSVEHAEHLANLHRFRAGVLITIPAWCIYGVLDYVSASWGADHETLTWLWSIRWGALPVVVFGAWGTLKKPPASPRLLRVLDAVVYNAASWCIALMAVKYGGIASSYASGILMAIVGRGAFTAQPWKSALAMNLSMASSFPVVMVVASFFVPAIRAQFSDPAAVSSAIHYASFNYGTMVLMLAATHYAWTLRRQLFESRSIGRYRLKSKLAAGGMGEVWAAYHPGLKRDIALKILRPSDSDDGTAIARFEREVKATSDLSHPNTIRVFDFGTTDDGIFYYAMELLDGVTLADLVRRDGPLEPARAVHLVIQASRSLAEAHERGIVHRDVKPANLFITRAGGESDFVKVLDFGIAKRMAGKASSDEDDGLDGELTRPGVLAGTPKYIAPELVLGEEASPRADVYGLGAVLYFTLAGRAPFERGSAAALYAAHVTDSIPPVGKVRGETLPPELEAVVARCLGKSPSTRFANASELARALEALGLHWRPAAEMARSVQNEAEKDSPTIITPPSG